MISFRFPKSPGGKTDLDAGVGILPTSKEFLLRNKMASIDSSAPIPSRWYQIRWSEDINSLKGWQLTQVPRLNDCSRMTRYIHQGVTSNNQPYWQLLPGHSVTSPHTQYIRQKCLKNSLRYWQKLPQPNLYGNRLESIKTWPSHE